MPEAAECRKLAWEGHGAGRTHGGFRPDFSWRVRGLQANSLHTQTRVRLGTATVHRSTPAPGPTVGRASGQLGCARWRPPSAGIPAAGQPTGVRLPGFRQKLSAVLGAHQKDVSPKRNKKDKKIETLMFVATGDYHR